LADGLCRRREFLFSLPLDLCRESEDRFLIANGFGSLSKGLFLKTKGVFPKTKGLLPKTKGPSLESEPLRLESKRLFVESERLLRDRTALSRRTTERSQCNLAARICSSAQCSISFDGGGRFSDRGSLARASSNRSTRRDDLADGGSDQLAPVDRVARTPPVYRVTHVRPREARFAWRT
jgi:hypothetical protein